LTKKDKIIQSALKLFVEKGFHASPTSLITKNAGVSAGILFHYFSTKEDLISSIFINVKKEFYRSGLNFDTNADSTIEFIFKRFWENVLEWGLNNPLKYRFLKQYHNSPFIERVYEDEDIKRYEEYFINFVVDGTKKGILKDMEPRFILNHCFIMLTALTHHLLENERLVNDRNFIENAWLLTWDSITSSK
jgi:TetR/AcrR family transcriptional regulator, multidrug resistance operon repressor